MAEGTIYFIQAEQGGPIKIGWSATVQGVQDRLQALQCGNPYVLVVRRTIPGGRWDESNLHQRFGKWRLSGEWFEPRGELPQIAKAKRNFVAVGLTDEMKRLLSTVRNTAHSAGFEEGMERGVTDAFEMSMAALRDRFPVAFLRYMEARADGYLNPEGQNGSQMGRSEAVDRA